MEHLWWPWLICNAIIIAIYFLWDSYLCFPKESQRDLERGCAHDATDQGFRIMAQPVAAVRRHSFHCLSGPDQVAARERPGNRGRFCGKCVQLMMVLFSLWMGEWEARVANKFNYHAIVEVAALFVGIFVCMQPAIEILHAKGGSLGLDSPRELYWATGGLSAVLDNAPTYVVFYETAASDADFRGQPFNELVSATGPLAEKARELLIGISLGAVFMGAMTYIGNGPNFMVRAIAEQSGVKMPSFFGYVFRYSLVILLPVFFLISLLVLH